MTENSFTAVTGQGMGRGGDKDRTGQVFMQVGPANATVRYFDLYFVGLGRCRHGYVFNANILLAMLYSCLHRLSHCFVPFCGK